MKKLIVMLLLGASLLPGLVGTDCLAKEPTKQTTATLAVNLNRASVAELQAVPGIGPATAERIVAYRDQHGTFTSLEQLVEVKGIGQAKLAKLRSHLTVD